ncbi:MAG: glycosyltransferase family 2 protein, partial [Clostridia bacterium]|nr:glycosyltransferase family 2 protein [Clostridia bacterium]
MSKISVLVAAYNVEKYITDAMASVVAQTLKDIEIVVVDDCSTDKTFEIITKFAALDSRIKVVRHKENGGIMRTRRDGFLNSSGDYIMFLDGDDTLKPDACKKAYEAITEEKLDLLEFGYDVIFTEPADNHEALEANLRKDLLSLDHKAVSISKAGILDYKATGGIVSSQLWNKIYKRDVLNN